MNLAVQSPIRAVIFDKDGTLFDFSKSWSGWADMMLTELAGPDAELADELARRVGYDRAARGFKSDSLAIAGTSAEVATALWPAVPDHTYEELLRRINTAAAEAPMVPVCPLRPFVQRLQARGLAVGVATNDAEEPARAHLRQENVEDLMDFIAGYDSGYGGKPAPGQLLAFADQLGVEPRYIAMVGDSAHDLVAAKAAGMRAVGVLTGIAGRSELSDLANVVLDSICDLEGWLDALGQRVPGGR